MLPERHGTGRHTPGTSSYVDGDYYYVDTTWGDPVLQAEEGGEASILGHISYDYMCCSEEQLLKTHTPDATAALPECTKMDANYYVVNGMYYETYDPWPDSRKYEPGDQ